MMEDIRLMLSFIKINTYNMQLTTYFSSMVGYTSLAAIPVLTSLLILFVEYAYL
jgi:hypothetical protein